MAAKVILKWTVFLQNWAMNIKYSHQDPQNALDASYCVHWDTAMTSFPIRYL